MPPVNPQQIKVRYADALRLLQAGQVDAAKTAFDALLKLLPDSPEVHFQLSRIAHHRGDGAARIDHLAQALRKKPNEPPLIEAAIDAHAGTGDTAAVLGLYDRLIALSGKAIKPQVDKASYLQSQGQFAEAEALFRRLIRDNPYDGELYRTFLGTKKLAANDPLMGKMRKALAHPRMSDAGKMHLNFAMAKALEDQGESAKVFAHLRRANALQRKAAPFDPAARDREQAAMLAAQDGCDLTPLPDGHEPTPIFVTGMPRSGTTLVEQIVASHSDVTAGGEMGHALRLALQMFKKGDAIRPLPGIADDELRTYAKAYTAALRRDTGARSGAVTDKSIQSHLVFGLIHRALPGARFIIVHRDPRDIAVSIYKNHFAMGTHRYANDLADIAEAIKLFRRSIAFWQERLPGALHEVRYEDLVADPEPQSRALIAAAGLEWQDQCLDFHKSKATVKTLSLHQVRQPIYKGSAQAWRKYEADLQPFFDAWGDTPWD
ncbi:tetratricopeptide repeat-containing sulfotransferase family protein [Aestuariicoccus sp. MJ-SS9]|uniref:tetratricopeptide repeat-containing sulfotransferase family protein n=1 Tax=Aestuariicoccus sp. MJ-SS9 TaxID=3079855 RepID=UPI00290A289C|nr:sulfotransferase [Aestuariicoccus sp. MJ-SS9]MDU8912924.1 sulfotransferase [Aestuariicoccus sp. MJ-SS9]